MTSSYRQYVKVQDSDQSWTSGQPHRTWCSQGSPTLGFVLCACDLRLLNFTETVYCKRSNGTMEHASGTCSLSPRVSCHLLLVFDLFLGHYSPTQVCPPPHILSQSSPRATATVLCLAGAWVLVQGSMAKRVIHIWEVAGEHVSRG